MSTSPRTASETDAQIGRAIRVHRIMAGITQMQMGEALGITYQQVQKYEAGTNRVSSSRLTEIAKVLGVPVMELLGGNGVRAEPGSGDGRPPQVGRLAALLSDRGALRLLDAYHRVGTERQKRALVALAEAMAGASADEEAEADSAD
jgi:transcriptional regulator with XRE-family HTH domain